jgi:two-component sensor histidine kinase
MTTGVSVPAASLLALAAINAVSLALEELVTSTIKYGYDDAGRHEIEIFVTLETAQVTLWTHENPQ